MSPEPGSMSSPAGIRELDLAEQRFYAVMHHMATVLWMKGATVEALAALSAVLEWTGLKDEDANPPPRA